MSEITLAQVVASIKLLESSDVGVTPKSVRESLEQTMGLEKNALKKQEPLIAALLDEARAAEELRLAEARPRGLLASPSGSLLTAGTLVRLALLPAFLYAAVRIRLFAVINYGYVIHEFDPWFNYRAAEYMVRNGWDAFQAWYDHECWYPLGRHVGSTTYPGLQLTAWAIYEVLQRIMPTSLNDVCVLIPAGFGAVAALFTGALAAEVSGSANAGVAAAGLMAILPAHLMRSVAGGFDNESIAITVRGRPLPPARPFDRGPALAAPSVRASPATRPPDPQAIVATFYFWVRSLRSAKAWPYAILSGVAYVYMVAAWGGYVFVFNLIGVHAGVLVLLGRFTPKLWLSYTLWFVIGTAGAVLGPARYLVGWQPFQSLEQLGPLGVLGGLQLLMVVDVARRKWKLSDAEAFGLTLKLFAAAGAAALVVGGVLLPEGFVGPLSARVRGLFIKHTKTGNPLVDSVAEHQATPTTVYWQYFHVTILLAPLGVIPTVIDLDDGKLFLLVYFVVSAYFSSKMIRLVLIMSPATAALAGTFVGGLIDFTKAAYDAPDPDDGRPKPAAAKPKGGAAAKAKPKAVAKPKSGGGGNPGNEIVDELRQLYDENVGPRRTGGAVGLAVVALVLTLRFAPHCWRVAQSLSEPQIMIRGRNRDGSTVVIDDFREAYWWLRDHTPADARVMAWWDYGYQINGVANRTTIADGNTWNHEHIALLGRCLVSSENESHAIVKHLADYVLFGRRATPACTRTISRSRRTWRGSRGRCTARCSRRSSTWTRRATRRR